VRFDIDAERRALEVKRARPVRVVPANPAVFPPHIHEVWCGSCGASLTVFDSASGLASMERWRVDGWTWRPQPRGHHRSRSGSPLRRANRLRLVAGDRVVAIFPVTMRNGWRPPDLPAVLVCHRCAKASGWTGLEHSV